MSLQVVAVITAKPGSESEVAAALGELVRATLAEDGCESYELNRSAADGAAFVTVERWRDQAALDAHLQGPAVAAALGAADGLLAAPPAIHPLVPVGS